LDLEADFVAVRDPKGEQGFALADAVHHQRGRVQADPGHLNKREERGGRRGGSRRVNRQRESARQEERATKVCKVSPTSEVQTDPNRKGSAPDIDLCLN
jgi:hypothetical protein